MITAHQAGKLVTATHLKTARDELAQTISAGCWKNRENREHEKISELITKIDELFSQLIPNIVD